MQDHIFIYDSSGTLTATITQVIDSRMAERLSGELTLSFTSQVDRLPEIAKETQIEFRGQYYRATQVQSSVSGNAFLISVSCEQESISLVDEEIEEFNFTGTADDALARLLDGTGMTATAEHEGTITISAAGGNRRSVLLEIAELCEGEIEYSGHEIRILNRRGSTEAIDIVQVCQCNDVVKSIDTRNGTESYELSGLNPDGYGVGDEVLLNFTRLGIHVQKRIIGISYNPFDCRSVSVEVGDYIVDITDDYAALEKIFLLKADAQIEFEKYINSAEGTAGIAAALSGTFVTQDALNDLVTTSELDARVEAYINGEEGIAAITESLLGTFVTEDELGDFATTTEVSTQIKQEISAFEASITLETSMSSSPTETEIGSYASIGGEYEFEKTSDGYYTSTNAGVASSYSYCMWGFSDISTAKTVTIRCISYGENNYDYGIISTLNSTLEASATEDTENVLHSFKGESSPDPVDITLDIPAGTSYITLKYIKDGSADSNGDYFKFKVLEILPATSQTSVISIKSGEITLDSAEITFTGIVTFESLATAGATTINGANITTGQISAERIDTSSLYVEKVYYSGDREYAILTSADYESDVSVVVVGIDGAARTDRNTTVLCGNAVDIAVDSMEPLLEFDLGELTIKPLGNDWTLGTEASPFYRVYSNRYYFDDGSYLRVMSTGNLRFYDYNGNYTVLAEAQ